MTMTTILLIVAIIAAVAFVALRFFSAPDTATDDEVMRVTRKGRAAAKTEAE